MVKSVGNWLSLSKKVLASRLGTLELPYKMTFVVTKRCHSRCENCRIWEAGWEGELTLAEIQKVAKSVGFLSWIDFTGGEPTDHPELVEIVKSFQAECPRLQLVHFPTNGIAPAKIEAAALGIRRAVSGKFVVTVSIDGPPETNAKIRGIPNGFERSIETLNRLEKIRGVDVFVGMTLYPSNFGLIDQTVAAIREKVPGFNHRRLHLNLGHHSEHYYENSEAVRKPTEGIVAAVQAFQTRRGLPRSPFDFLERRYHRGLADFIGSGRTPVPCASLQSSFFLSEKGVVFPCSIWNEPLGNVREVDYDIQSILRQEAARSARKRIEAGGCPQCWTPCEAYQSIAASFPQ